MSQNRMLAFATALLSCTHTDSLLYAQTQMQASDAFGKTRQAISGKIGGMQDDLCIALQLGIYVSSKDVNK